MPGATRLAQWREGVAVIYTEDRDTFERDMFRPPHAARMLEATGLFTGRMRDADKEAFLELALDTFWALRNTIHNCADIQKNWLRALKTAALSRDKWLLFTSIAGVITGREWVLGRRLGDQR